ncbi:MAG: hypothetical protein JSR77_18065 [Planctomycetes bacterium]|nr:hypothetical protein [Planctomycetota bacterium]
MTRSPALSQWASSPSAQTQGAALTPKTPSSFQCSLGFGIDEPAIDDVPRLHAGQEAWNFFLASAKIH